MTNVNISPFSPPPLDEHEMGHVLSEMADQERDDGKVSRVGWKEILIDVGYAPRHVDQILDRWFVKCTTCGEDATHLWAVVGEDGSISSMLGNGKFSPSCDSCTGDPSTFETPQTGVLRAPLDFDPSRDNWTVQFDDTPERVAEWICNRQSDTLGAIMRAIDYGTGREILAKAIRMYAQAVAGQSLNELHHTTFDEVLLDLVSDARNTP